MLRENTVFAQKIIDFYTDKGVECSVVGEHLSLLVTLSADGKSHEFRYGNRAFGEIQHCKKFYLALDRELDKLKAAPAEEAAVKKTKLKCRIVEDAGEEVSPNI